MALDRVVRLRAKGISSVHAETLPIHGDHPGTSRPARAAVIVVGHRSAGQHLRDRSGSGHRLAVPGLDECLLRVGAEPRDVPVSGFRCNRRFRYYRFSAAGMRSAKVTANALSAGFHLVVHRACSVPLGSTDRVTRESTFSAACSDGECPRARTGRRNLALSDSIALVEHRTVRISMS